MIHATVNIRKGFIRELCGLDGKKVPGFNVKLGFLIESRENIPVHGVPPSGQFEEGDFRQDPHPAGIPDKAEAAIDIKLLCPFFV